MNEIAFVRSYMDLLSDSVADKEGLLMDRLALANPIAFAALKAHRENKGRDRRRIKREVRKAIKRTRHGIARSEQARNWLGT